jgi:hypothetical protein
MWDDDIDEVARALTAARTPPALKARVMARIRDDARARVPWQHWWVWSPVAVAVVLILAVVFRAGWRAQPTKAPSALAGRTIAPPSASLPAPVALETIQATTIGRRTTLAAPAVRADVESTVAPLPQLTVERLNLERVQLKTIPAPETIALKTLEMTPLELAPLTPERPKAEGEKDDTTLVRPRRNLDAGGRISLRSGDTSSATDTQADRAAEAGFAGAAA